MISESDFSLATLLFLQYKVNGKILHIFRISTLFIDCHTHLDQYPPEELPLVLEGARQAQVEAIVCAGTTLPSSRLCLKLAETHDILLAGIGLHPMDLTGPVDDDTYRSLKALAQDNPGVVCVSEIGLDFLSTSPPRDVQFQAFRRQIHLALELELPIVFHSRESHPQVLQVLREEGAQRVGGAFHYFQADEATAKEAIDNGFFISLAKPLLRLPKLQEVAKKLPLEHIVLETDSFPQPWKKYRHNWTEPHHVRTVAEKLAELRGMTLEEVGRITSANARKMLRLA